VTCSTEDLIAAWRDEGAPSEAEWLREGDFLEVPDGLEDMDDLEAIRTVRESWPGWVSDALAERALTLVHAEDGCFQVRRIGAWGAPGVPVERSWS
jgi:hypothetical protein